MINRLKLLNRLKYIILSVIILNVISCTPEDGECETETVCYGNGNCVEKPIPGTCF